MVNLDAKSNNRQDSFDSSSIFDGTNTIGVEQDCLRDSGILDVVSRFIRSIKLYLVERIGEDWIFLSLLGLSMSIISFAVDVIVEMLRNCIIKSYVSSSNLRIRYFVWTCLPVSFVLFSSLVVQIFAPHAAGSGIPELRAILRGVQVSPKFLTISTAIVKLVALTAALGSGVPIGKTGPFVHICSSVAVMIGNWLRDGKQDVSSMTLIYHDMLVVACAIGVAATFNAPIGGVLFSIEVTASHFNIKNYWRGFYASLLGALLFRSISLARDKTSTLLPLEFLKFNTEHPFAPVEIIFFAILGIYSGIFGAIFTVLYKQLIRLENRLRGTINVKVWKVLYTLAISILIFSTTFPHSIGRFMGKDQTVNQKLKHLLSFGFWNGDMAKQWTQIQETWSHNNTFGYLAIFFTVNFILSVLASTLPIPVGLFAPLFLLGGTFGRLFGELLAIVFPDGLSYPSIGLSKPIIPAGYALAGAAGFSGSATHTLSIAVIAVEVTGEIVYLLPIMVAVTLGNIVAKKLHTSIYDTIIKLKKLPLMPEITSDNFRYFDIKLFDFMNKEFRAVDVEASANQLANVICGVEQFYYPVVEDNRILVGITTRDWISEYLNCVDKKRDNDETCSGGDLNSADVELGTLSSARSNQNIPEYSELQTINSVHQLPAETSLNDVHTIFQLLGLRVACVTVDGCLQGVVTEKEIEEAVIECSECWQEMKNRQSSLADILSISPRHLNNLD